MKKNKGFVLIEVLIALVIFLIGIFPIISFTLNSLGTSRMTTEIEEGSRVVSTVIDYVKSRGYENVFSDISWDSKDGYFENEYYLKYDVIESSYVVNTKEGGDFEMDFYGSSFYDESNTDSDALFILESRGIDLEGAKIKIIMKKSDISLEYDDKKETSYRNPITNKKTEIIYGEDGILENQVIYGTIKLEYTSKKDSSLKLKEYEQNFILVPLENWK